MDMKMIGLVIAILVIIGLIAMSPFISQMMLGDVKNQEQAREAVEDMSTDIEDIEDILGDIDDSLG